MKSIILLEAIQEKIKLKNYIDEELDSDSNNDDE